DGVDGGDCGGFGSGCEGDEIMEAAVIWWSEDDVWRGGVEREKVVCRLLAGVGVAGNLAGKDGGARSCERGEGKVLGFCVCVII
ncbi:hypothetical protein Tco_0777250, partial [Tanacetum coccineum]